MWKDLFWNTEPVVIYKTRTGDVWAISPYDFDKDKRDTDVFTTKDLTRDQVDDIMKKWNLRIPKQIISNLEKQYGN